MDTHQPRTEITSQPRPGRRRWVTAGATALLAVALAVGGTAPAYAYDYTKMVQGSSKATCLGQITKAAMNPPAGMTFAHHSGCSYNASLRYWIAAVSFDRR